MSVSSRRRPRRQRRGGRGHSPSSAFGRAGPPGEAALLRAERGAAGALCAVPRAGPGRAAAGLSRRQPRAGSILFRGTAAGRQGRRPGVRGAPERPLCLLHPGGGGRWARAAGDALGGVARAPTSRGGGSPRGTSGLATLCPLRAHSMQPSGGWRAPDLPRRWDGMSWRLHRGFSHPYWGAEGSARTKN